MHLKKRNTKNAHSNYRATKWPNNQTTFFFFSSLLEWIFFPSGQTFVFDDIFSSSSSVFPKTFTTTSVCPVHLDTLSSLKCRRSTENHLHDLLLPRRSVLLFDNQTTLISYPFWNIWYLLTIHLCSSSQSTSNMSKWSNSWNHSNDNRNFNILNAVFVRTTWKYILVTSFSFVNSWVRKNHCRTCTDFLVNASSSYDFALDWVTQTSTECVTFR